MDYSPYEGREPHSRRTNLETNARTSSNSQSSSLDDSLNSQLSQTTPNAAGHLEIYRPRGATEPSTSFSNSSSQERRDPIYSVEPDGSIMDQDGEINVPVAEESNGTDDTSAPKRMVNGELKPSGSSLPTTPIKFNDYKHSRNNSRTSRGSQIGELSNQLQTRLSYAMVKVQNGWQSHNISELESITSNQTSPVSAVSDVHWPYERRLQFKSAADASTFMQLSEGAAADPIYARLSPRNSAINVQCISEHRQHAEFDPSSRAIKVGAAYESFWRDHEASGVSRPTETLSVGPSLAPPADIVARAPRRSDATKKQPPPLRTNNLGTALTPVTPHARRQSKIRTPSQQAEVEKDAVETLLFMSSPGNSGKYPPGTLARTSMRNHVERQDGQTDSRSFPGPNQDRGRQEKPGIPHFQHLRSPTRKRPLSDAEMDRILDEMPDTSSSDDGELQNTFQPPHSLER